MKLPERVQAELQPNLNVRWWGRRATFEVVAEVSEAVALIWIIISAGILFESITRLEGWKVAVVVFVLCLFAANHAFLELMNWKKEIYVVVEDTTNNGGRVYKFYGWLNQKTMDEPITPSSPTIIADNPVFYRVWGHITGERMERVLLKSQNHTFLEGQRISPSFVKAIKEARGYKAPKQELTAGDFANIREIGWAVDKNLLDRETAIQATKAIVIRNSFG